MDTKTAMTSLVEIMRCRVARAKRMYETAHVDSASGAIECEAFARGVLAESRAIEIIVRTLAEAK